MRVRSDRWPCTHNRVSLQFESKRVSADELEQYLHLAEQEAKEAEARALAQADAGVSTPFASAKASPQGITGWACSATWSCAQAVALRARAEFTPAWRNTGLPMKPSHLQLDAQRMSSAHLVNPKYIMSQYQQVAGVTGSGCPAWQRRCYSGAAANSHFGAVGCTGWHWAWTEPLLRETVGS